MTKILLFVAELIGNAGFQAPSMKFQNVCHEIEVHRSVFDLVGTDRS